MKIFKVPQVREIDQYTIENEPVRSIDLMERAAGRVAGWYVRHFNISRKVLVFAGPGNNGGDALATARLLAERQYRVACYLLKSGKLSEDCSVNRKRLEEQGMVPLVELAEGDDLPAISPKDVVVDGIFGSGLSRPVEGFPATVIRHINGNAATVVAIDIPSGLFGEDNSGNDYDHVVKADYTITFQFPFLSFFFDTNDPYAGRWRVHDIGLHPDAIRETETPYRTLEIEELGELLPRRQRFSHKGSYGHALVIAGSYGMMGAALLAGESCLRAGTGLVTMHVPGYGYGIVQTGFPEGIVSLDPSVTSFSEPPETEKYTAIGVGPGIGRAEDTEKGLKKLLEKAGAVPMVIDADGLNILSAHPEWYGLIPRGSVLTPHPKEFDRLAGKSDNSFQRHLKQIGFAREHGVIVVLKGAYTGIADPDGNYWFNTTGNPGMASGGSGDVLTGLITGLLARGMKPLHAAMAGVCLHGLAGDLAVEETGEEALIAGDLIAHLGKAFMRVSR
ncbi:MAG TPA: NAD(P)H-hydrate dehydratase [Bacteroides sp.]|nr:NAD(P)H-hydrate dehydratase [Bacteroides sp.]